LSESAVSYDFEPLQPSEPPPRDAAARALAEARAEAERIREQARAQGHAEGIAAGHADGLAEISSAAGALGDALAGVSSLRDEVAEELERDAIELALSLAEKVLAASLQARPELVVEVVQGALRRLNDRRRITVLVNPRDLQTVKEALGELQTQANGIELADLQSDQRVGVGGAIVRSAEGELDASVETQLQRAREVVTSELSGGARP
jgi:flagellar assembly protein FliH